MPELERQRNGRVKAHVLRRIKGEHIEKALDALDAGTEHPFGPSTDYDLQARGRAYPPKAVLGVAARFALGVPLTTDDFSGGEHSTCFRVLREAGFTVAPKSAHKSPPRSSRAWIFQANPDAYDVDTYLQRPLEEITWTVRQHRKDLQPGDRVFLWRSSGKDKKPSGIIAIGRLLDGPQEGAADPHGADLWTEGARRDKEWRVRLKIEARGSDRKIIKREWLLEDPIAQDLSILKQAAGTNFGVPEPCRQRLEQLWDRTGEDWTRSECIAALWAYEQADGKELSKLPGSPVSQVALRIGRDIDSVRSKAMTFGALNPRDSRRGLLGSSAADAAVWSEFFDADAGRLRSEELREAYEALYEDPGIEPNLEPESLDSPPPPGARQPGRLSQWTNRVARDTKVTRWVKILHDFRCQVCGERFDTPRGPVAEGAHIKPLGAPHEGHDEVGNVLCLCPTHHALFDRGAFWIDQDLGIASDYTDGLLDELITDARHALMMENLAYHRQLIARQEDEPSSSN